MRLRLTCKTCGTAFAVDARHAGKKGRCPNSACRRPILIPFPKKSSSGPASPKKAAQKKAAKTANRVAPQVAPLLPPRQGTKSVARRQPQSKKSALPYLAVAAVVVVSVSIVLLRNVFSPAVPPVASVAPSSGALVAAEPPSTEPQPAVEQEDPAFAETIHPFMVTYCIDCHGPDYAEAELDFSTFDSVASLQADRQRWNQILGIIRIGAMPPPDHEPQPPMAVRNIVTDWLDHTLNYVDCDVVDDPGHVTIRRLNRVEYNNTIRDLVGVDFEPAADFPSDDVGNGFDNQGEVLSLPPLLMEKYLDAAEEITQRAIVTDFDALLTQRKRGGRLPSVAEVSRKFDFRPGKYLLRAEVEADQAGNELAKAEFRFDGKALETFEVQGQRQPNVFEVAVTIENAGEKAFAVKFLNDYYNPKAKDRRQRDRNLEVNWLEIQGPEGKLPALPDTHTGIVFTSPRDGKSVRQAAEEIFTRFTARAYRRPADPDQVAQLVNLVEMAVDQGESFEVAVSFGVQAVLVSPHFLFRFEDDLQPADDNGKVKLSDYELASRLSYFLWSSMPDEELFDLAERKELSQPEVIEAQVKRMLADPKSEALVVNFFGQWLNLRTLEEISPNSREFAWWNSKLKAAMQRETELFCAAIVQEDLSILEVLQADFTYANPRLAELYGIQWKDQDPRELYYNYDGPGKNQSDYRGNRRSGYYQHEDEYIRVDLPDNRRGVLTHASILALTSNPGETSPVKRGKWILDNILGEPPPPAPPGVPSFDEVKKAKPDATLREQLAMHRSDPGCASCHTMMDPLGLGFEHYDVIGQWRDKDGKLDVDASGTLDDGQSFVGALELIDLLEERDDQFARHFIERLMTYALGRGLMPYDRCAVDTVYETARSDEYRFSTIVTEIVESNPFRMRRGGSGQP